MNEEGAQMSESNHHMPPPPMRGFPFFHGMREENVRPDWQNRSLNNQLKLTKKCYRMVEKLGGEPEKYEDFVKQRLDKRFP